MREETVLSLKWHSFPSHLAGSLDTCYEKQQFVDISLVCKDGTILKCHKMVLANSSSFFRRLLVANDHPHPMIILHDIEADDLKTIINFMYCGEIQVVQSEVRRLLKLAEILEVTGLRHIQTSVLIGESNNSWEHVPRKTTTVSRLKPEDKNSSTKTAPDHEINTRSQSKQSSHSTRLVSSAQSHKNVSKSQHDVNKKNDEINVTAINQRFETGRSGISIIDINEMPSTSKRLPNPPSTKRRDTSNDSVISWPHVLSALSKDKQLPLKRLCIMDEVEITASKTPSSSANTRENSPLDRRKSTNNAEIDPTMKCAVFIKDELDISMDMEEDDDMDPLEVEEVDSENLERAGSSRIYSFSTNIDTSSYSTGTLPDFPPRKGSNG